MSICTVCDGYMEVCEQFHKDLYSVHSLVSITHTTNWIIIHRFWKGEFMEDNPKEVCNCKTFSVKSSQNLWCQRFGEQWQDIILTTGGEYWLLRQSFSYIFHVGIIALMLCHITMVQPKILLTFFHLHKKPLHNLLTHLISMTRAEQICGNCLLATI